MKLTQTVAGLAAAALLTLSAGARAQTTYQVVTNTSSLTGIFGNLDLQFNKGLSSALNATATISGVLPDGATLAPNNTLTGGATGLLPGGAAIANSGVFNDLFQGIKFGSTMTFNVTFTGPAVGAAGPAGSVFALSLYDVSGTIPLLTSDPNGSVADIALNPAGDFTTTTYPTQPGTPAVSTITLVNQKPPAVPEPTPLALLGLGLAPLALIVRKGRAA